jgi:hypothetical protein
MDASAARLDRPTRAEWEATWRECHYATFFQSPAWAELWERVSDGQTRCTPERLTFPNGHRAILPLCFEHKLRGLLSRHVASPQATFGGWITKDALDLKQASVLLQHTLARRQTSLVWRMNPYDKLMLLAGKQLGLECKRDYTHALNLEGGAPALLARFKNGYRSDIQKAQRQQRIAIDAATTLDEWRAYYRVYVETLGRWGHTAEEGYPWKVFQTMAELRSPDITLWLGRYDGAIVSGELCMYSKRHVVSWHAATLGDYLRTNIAKVQIYHVISDACSRGFRWFDFNPSAGLAGVQTFKESFDARALPAPLVYVDSTLKRYARGVAGRLGVPYAKLSLERLEDVLGSDAEAGAEHGRPSLAEARIIPPAARSLGRSSAPPAPLWEE